MMAGRSGDTDDLGADHPDVDELIDYVLGALSQREAGGVRAHAARCVACGDQLAALILLCEGRLNAEDVAAPTATVVRFPVAAKMPARRWPRPAAAAAAVALILAVAWFIWPPPGQPTEQDWQLALATTVELEGLFALATQTAAVGDAPVSEIIGRALSAFNDDDLQGAREGLELFRDPERWHRFGTALLGYALFLQEDPGARAVLEMYRARHTNPTWDANAGVPEDLAFFFLARLRLADGDQAGAQEAVGWISREAAQGRAAEAWSRAQFGDASPTPSPDVHR